VKHSAIVAGYAVSFSTIAAVQSATLLILGVLAFKVTIVGNMMLAFLVIVLLAMVSLSIGILLSARARDETQAIQMFPFVVMPTFLLAGVFWPLEALPGWLRPLSYLVPPTYAVRACRSVMTRGWGVSQIWVDLLALLGLAVAFLTGAVWSVKRHRV
jgi:ABC-2 type transport system permease protein